MRNAVLLLALLAAPLGWAQSAAPSAPSAVVQQETVGVAPVKVPAAVVQSLTQAGRDGEVARFSQALELQLASALSAARKLKVVTRADLNTVLREQDLAASGNVDVDDARLAQRFKLAGAGNVLQVTITDYQDRVRTFHSSVLGQTMVRRDLRVVAVASLIDTTTGVVRESVAIPPVTQEDLDQKFPQVRDSAASGEEMVNALANLVAASVSDRLTEVLYPARVLSRNGDTVLINRGDGTGIAVGQEWAVYATGEPLIDPDTGEKLGVDEVLIGRVVVTELQPKFARARVVKDQGIARGQIARQAAATLAPATE